MSEMHAETTPMKCTTSHCTCEIPRGTGYKHGDEVYCSEQCANPKTHGCGHDGCPCNKVD